MVLGAKKATFDSVQNDFWNNITLANREFKSKKPESYKTQLHNTYTRYYFFNLQRVNSE